VYWCGPQGENTAVTTLELAGSAATATAGDADADAMMNVSDDVSETRQTYVALGSALGVCLGGGGVQGGGLILLNKVIFTSLHAINFFVHLNTHSCRSTSMSVLLLPELHSQTSRKRLA
jgi:hypothetical protein